MRNRLIAAAATLGLLAGCTAGNIYMYPPEIAKSYLITMGESPRPYVSKGFVQITAKGANLAGFFPVMDADLQKMFGELLIPEIEKAGADGIVHLDFKETQHPTATKAFFAVLFFIPLPTSVEITGELVEFTDAPTPDVEVGSDDLGMALPALPGRQSVLSTSP